jgi:hypothetical protein
MSHWFTGWKFWPERPQGPVDAKYEQVTWIRPYRPGPIRTTLALLGVIVTAFPASLAFSILLSPGPILGRLVYGLAFALFAIGLAVLVSRFFAVGVYVNDAGMRIARISSMRVYPWALVTDVSIAPHSGRGPTDRADLVVVTVRDIGPINTPVRRRSPDFLWRPESFDMASLAIERWWRDAGTIV